MSGELPPDAAAAADFPVEREEAALESKGADLSLTKIEKSLTDSAIVPASIVTTAELPQGDAPAAARRPGRPARTTEAPVTWSVRGVSRETRQILEQGAAQAGKTLGQYINEDIRALVEHHLHHETAPATLHEEIQYLRRLVENLTSMVATATGLSEPHSPPPEH